MFVENLTSTRGTTVPNQFVIHLDDGTILFQSYRSIIVRKKNGKITLGTNWDYSQTTGKYRNMFLQETKKETERKIKQGIYTVEEL